jgi:hypothetical protein
MRPAEPESGGKFLWSNPGRCPGLISFTPPGFRNGLRRVATWDHDSEDQGIIVRRIALLFFIPLMNIPLTFFVLMFSRTEVRAPGGALI